MNQSTHLPLLVLTLILCLATTASSQEKVYRIGNSLTWDSQPKAIEQIAAQRNIDHVQAYHIACGKALEWIWNHPQNVCVDPVQPYGTFKSALPAYEWDAITIQPYRPYLEDPERSSLSSDTRRFLDLIELARSRGRNKSTTFYLYYGWPARSSGPYHKSWKSALPDSKPVPTRLTRPYFQRLLKRIKSQTEVSVQVIPVGEVLFELDRMARSGKIPGYKSAHDFYRDRVHLTNVGRFSAALTTFCVISNQTPEGLTKPENQFGNSDPFTSGVYDAIYEAVSSGIARAPGPGIREKKKK